MNNEHDEHTSREHTSRGGLHYAKPKGELIKGWMSQAVISHPAVSHPGFVVGPRLPRDKNPELGPPCLIYIYSAPSLMKKSAGCHAPTTPQT